MKTLFRYNCMDFVAYCAALYLRKETNTGVYVNLLTAKTKVAPLNKLTIPRLELLSCLLLANLVTSVINSLNCCYVNLKVHC